ncbi:MAG: hypothetical protein F4X87_02860 [Chloroflexi bacterium]|nr:hypothetical protein [Chloroflexota bacterium]
MACRIDVPKTGRPDKDHENLQKLQCDLLEWAEDLFGERDTSWDLIPQPVFGRTNPKIFFPGDRSLRLVRIKLSPKACDKWTFALFQIAHEVIHLLNPLPKDEGKANNLEEGVACAFSYHVQDLNGIVEPDFVSHNHPAYMYAHCLTNNLPGGAIAGAQRIRQGMPTGSSFSSISKVNLQRIFPGISKEFADELTRKFDRNLFKRGAS